MVTDPLVNISRIVTTPSRGVFREAVRLNLNLGNSRGAGNRWRRRTGIAVADSTVKYPYAMSAGEFVRWFRDV